MEKFSLRHVVLYAKGWYKRTDNIFNDLSKLLEMDGYLGTFEGDSEAQIKNRVAYLLLSHLQRIPLTGNARTLVDFFESVKEGNCWKYGYYTKNNYTFKKSEDVLPDYDFDEAVVRYCLSHFGDLSKGQWDTIPPDFTRFPKGDKVTNKRVKEVFYDVL